MKKDVAPKPTEAELGILKALWKQGPSTVREVLEGLPQRRRPGYTTVLKLLQIMHGKGLVDRDESRRTHVYEACFSEERTLDQLVSDLVQRAFDGSASRLALRALSTKKASPEELAEVRRLLDAMEEKE